MSIVITSCAIVFGSLLVFARHAQKNLRSGMTFTDVSERRENAGSPAAQIIMALLCFALCITAFAFFTREKVGSFQLLPTLIFSVIFFPVLAFSVSSWKERLGKWIAPAPGLVMACGWIALLSVIALSTPGASAWPLVRVGLIGCVALALLGTRKVAGNAARYPFRLALAVLVIWIPIEFDLIQAFRLGVKPAQFDISRTLIYVLGLTLFLVVAKLPKIGYTLILSIRDCSRALVGLLSFSAVAIPLGLSIGFIGWQPESIDPVIWFVRAIYIFFCIALPEELLFRGVIQGLLERHWPGSGAKAGSVLIGSVIYAATIFGVAHINNPMPGRLVPNWDYVLMSSLAGIAYGWVWQRTRRITASALTHAAVDWIWVTMFR